MFFLFYLWIPLFYIIILVDKPSSLGQNYSASNGGAAEADNYLRVLIVGDSVNRCMVQDWCSKYSGTLLMDHSTDSTNFSTPYPVSYYFKRFGKRGYLVFSQNLYDNGLKYFINCAENLGKFEYVNHLVGEPF